MNPLKVRASEGRRGSELSFHLKLRTAPDKQQQEPAMSGVPGAVTLLVAAALLALCGGQCVNEREVASLLDATHVPLANSSVVVAAPCTNLWAIVVDLPFWPVWFHRSAKFHWEVVRESE